MFRLLRYLIFGHVHEWEIENTSDVYAPGNDHRPHNRVYVLRCKHCGNLKFKRVFNV